jgi:CRP-like cAMP-binding protein
MADDLRKLKDDAARAAERGRHRRAAELYLQVAERERDDPQWPQRAGEALKRSGAPAEALPHLEAAAAGYARLGFGLKAVALAKVILQLDPEHAPTKALLSSLSKDGAPRAGARTSGPRDEGAEPAGGEPLLTVDDVAPIALPPGAPIDVVQLVEHVRGARPSVQFETIRAYEIPLDNASIELELAEAPRPLPRIPLFSSLDEKSLRRLIERAATLERAPGDAIVREGERGRALYVVVRGEVEVTAAAAAAPLGRLGEGAFFGELGLLTDLPRSATVSAATPCELLEIDRDAIASLLERDGGVLRTLLAFFRDRLIDRLLATSPLFAGFSPDEARDLASRFAFLELDAGSVMAREGERTAGLFVLLAGSCAVEKAGAPAAALGPGDLCGEMSLLHQAPAAATVRTTSRTWALGLPRERFQELIVTHPQVLIYVSELAEQRRALTEKLRLV